MRHQHKGFKLGRTSAHRKATMASMSSALIHHKRITTTLTKAKALRMFVEPIINRAKDDSTHNRRQAFRYLRDKHAVTILFNDVAEKIADRPGGYCRIVKLGQRAGDSAEMAIIELVDYNDVRPEGSAGGRTKKTRRAGRRRSGGGSKPAESVAGSTESAGAVADVDEETTESAEATETVEEVVDTVEDDADAPKASDDDADEIKDSEEKKKKDS